MEKKRYYHKIEGNPKRYYIGWKPPELQPGERRKSYPPSENTAYRSELKHDTGLGFYTNSKSEAIIALRYHAFGVPFQYEKKLRLADYHAADILLGRDLFVTMDGPNEDLMLLRLTGLLFIQFCRSVQAQMIRGLKMISEYSIIIPLMTSGGLGI